MKTELRLYALFHYNPKYEGGELCINTGEIGASKEKQAQRARGYKGSGPQMSEPLPRAAAEPENRSTRTTSAEGTALQDLIAEQAAGHRIIGTINLPVRAPPSSAKEPEPAAPVSAAPSPAAPQREVGN